MPKTRRLTWSPTDISLARVGDILGTGREDEMGHSMSCIHNGLVSWIYILSRP